MTAMTARERAQRSRDKRVGERQAELGALAWAVLRLDIEVLKQMPDEYATVTLRALDAVDDAT